MTVTTHPRPNLRLVAQDAPSDHLDLWGLERQACGIEPGELALSRPYAVMGSRPDVWFWLMVAGLGILLVMDLWHALSFLAQVRT